ncbi:MAG: cob(I)yrinic acid a,c-diamide adenosyltransferase [Spartobacteria bacterium]|nr:cob(I)yrinic acid a,c-diamide adenosyltransferase [Spartobacteria bacterium]
MSAHKESMRKTQSEQQKKVEKARISRGVVIVNTGDGKGKSTAAFGTAMRSAGYGMKVCIIQFIKGNGRTGEQLVFERFDEITHIVVGNGFTWDTQDQAKDIDAAMKGWEMACDTVESASKNNDVCQLLVLDEINIAMDLGLIPTEAAVDTIKNKPEHLSIILTGRNAPAEIIAVADTVTEMEPVKHAFERGIQARRGIEY